MGKKFRYPIPTPFRETCIVAVGTLLIMFSLFALGEIREAVLSCVGCIISYLIFRIVKRLNLRDDPRHTKRPLDPP
jgi:hypothetical protein